MTEEQLLIKIIAEIVYKKSNRLIALLQKYGSRISPAAGIKEIVTETVNVLKQQNQKFNEEFALLAKGTRYSYWIGAAITGVVTVVGGIIGGVRKKKDRELTDDQLINQTTQQIMQMKQDEEQRGQNQKTATIVIVGIIITIAGIIIYKKTIR